MIDTHYMYRPPVLDADTFAVFIADCRKLLAALPVEVVLRSEQGVGKPTVSNRRIGFNGDRERGLEHEPLVIEQTYTRSPQDRMRNGVFFDFCKTNGKPYDIIVVAILYAFIHRLPTCKFVSDSKLAELKPGFDLFFNTCRPSGDLDALFNRPIVDRMRGDRT